MRSWVRRASRAVAAVMSVMLLGGMVTGADANLVPPLGLSVAPPGLAPTAVGTLDDLHPVLTFAGSVDNPTPLPLVSPPAPIVCALTCQAYTFVTDGRAPFLVSVKDDAGSTDNGWDLSVYAPSGAFEGAANGIGANGQALEIVAPQQGVYRVYVTFTYAYASDATFAGEVRLMRGPSWKPPASTCGIKVSGVAGCFMLPVLQAAPATDFHVGGLPPAASTPLGFPLPFALPTSTSCYVDETLQQGAMRCLRFTSDVRNVGAGLLDIRIPWLTGSTNGTITSGFVDGQCNASQAVHGDDGSTVLRPAGQCMFHPIHGHFHYKDLVGFSLNKLGANGAIGPRVGNGLKESFCLGDDNYFGFGSAGPNGPRHSVGQPGCNLPASLHSGNIIVEEGVAPGWGDVYTWDTPGQYIDITNTPPGRYALVERTNPSNTLLVAGPAQACAATELTLTATSVIPGTRRASVPCPA